MPIWFKQTSDKKELIYNGLIHEYNFMGNLVTDNGVFNSSHLNGAVRVNVVSLLKSGVSSLEVGILQGEKFTRFSSGMSFETAMSTLIVKRGHIGMLQKSSQESGVSYTQMMFIYPEVIDLTSKLREYSIIQEEVK